MAKNCPKCQRPNGDRAERCIYCAAVFPAMPARSPAAAKPSSEAAPAESAPAPAPERKSLESYQVAVSPGQTPADDALRQLADLLNLDLFSARQKLLFPSPWIARAFPDSQPAQALVSRLEELGLDAYVVKQSGVDKVMDQVKAVRIASVSDAGLVFSTADGREVPLAYADQVLIVRGRIQERPEREEDLEDDLPTVNIGKMMYSDKDEDDKGMVREAVERLAVRPRSSRMSWVLRPGAGSEAMDVYHKKSHQAVRIVESEFDYSGLGDAMLPSSLQNFNSIFLRLREHNPDVPVDNNFNLIGYTFNEAPNQDKVKNELQAALGLSDSSKKLYDNRRAFSEHSARTYLHLLHRRAKTGSVSVPERPAVKHLKLAAAPRELGPWLFFLTLALIFLKPLAAFISTLYSVSIMSPYFSLFPHILAYTAADAVLNIAVTVFGVTAGINLLYNQPNAIRRVQAFLGLFLLYHIWATFLPVLTDLNAPGHLELIERAGLPQPPITGISVWSFISFITIMAITIATYYYLATSRRVLELFPKKY